MGRYLLSRLLLMIPTFVGILLINFVVLRLQSATLVEQLKEGGRGQEGVAQNDQKATGASKRLENYIDRFRRSGNDLPALINTRGFLTQADLVAWLERTLPGNELSDSERSRTEKELWLCGRFAVQPLAAILNDPTQVRLYGPAAQALGYCAYTSISPRDAETWTRERLLAVQERNEILRQSAIAWHITATGAVVSDPLAESKRLRLIHVIESSGAEFSQAGRWRALLVDTGFVSFLSKLVSGDLYSESKQDYVFNLIADRWAVTAWLNGAAVALAWMVAIPIGIRSARRAGTLEDRATTGTLFLLWSMPSYFVGTLLLHHLCTSTESGPAWFPNIGVPGAETLWLPTPEYLLVVAWHAALPLLTLTYASFTALSRYVRAQLLGEMTADYARTARAKGVSEDGVVYRHCLPNATITLITLGAGLLAELFGGVLIVELIFSVPGLGRLLLDAALQQDAPLLLGATVVQVGLLLVGILIADLLYAVVDPRIRSRYA